MSNLVCKCGKGYASEFDGMCKYCRENTVRRAVAKKFGVRHRGDGMSVEQYLKATKPKKIPGIREFDDYMDREDLI